MLELSTASRLTFSSIISADAHDELLRELDNTSESEQSLADPSRKLFSGR